MAPAQDYRQVRRPRKPAIFQRIGDITSYPPPKEGVWTKLVAPQRPLLGFLPPPPDKARPEPSRLPLTAPPAGWRRSLHAAPAAYPSLYREEHGELGLLSQPWGGIAPNATKEQKAARVDEWCTSLVRERYDAKDWSLDEAKAANPRKQWLSVERWTRDEPTEGGYTLVCCHAGGLQKEVSVVLVPATTSRTDEQHWHAVLRRILELSPTAAAERFGGGTIDSPYEVQIDEVWMMDDMHHNESVYLNEGRLGAIQTWEDTGRDFLNLVTHVIPQFPVGGDVPWDVPWSESPAPRRRILGLGHSFGGAAVSHAAHARPDLLEGIFLVDPVPVPHYTPREAGYADPPAAYPVTTVVLKRRDVWPSREAARELMLQNPFFIAFDPDQFEIYLARALVPLDPRRPDGPVTLATPVWAEACVFTEPCAGARGWDKLPHIPIPVAFVMAGNSATTRGDRASQQMVHRPPRARNERWLHCNHLLVQESPAEVAESLWRFLATLSAGEWDAPVANVRDANL